MNKTIHGFEVFGQYIFLKKIASGGMAEVYLTRPSHQDGHGRVQVIKRVLPHIATHSAFLNMFQREIRIIMGLNHPNIVQLHDFGNFDNQPYIVMEYIEGKNIKEIVSKFNECNEPMPIPMALSLIAQAAAGLSYAHEFVNKITDEELHAIHRDISPHNLIVSYEGNLKVIDFGIAKAACSIHDMTQAGVIKGKAAYISPEQILGEEVDARTDIFALGIVLWEMLTNRRLFAREGESEMTTMSKVCDCEKYIEAPSTYNSQIPAEIDDLVLSALRKKMNERIGSAKEFQKRLRELLLKYYPHFSYSDVGKKMCSIFVNEISTERLAIRELSNNVQAELTNASCDQTQAYIYQDQSTPVRLNLDNGSDRVNVRLANIEKLMQQKASGRHYLLLLFYIIVLTGFKFYENYDFEDEPPSKIATNQIVTKSKNSAKKNVSVSIKPIEVKNRPVKQVVRSSLPAPKKILQSKKIVQRKIAK